MRSHRITLSWKKSFSKSVRSRAIMSEVVNMRCSLRAQLLTGTNGPCALDECNVWMCIDRKHRDIMNEGRNLMYYRSSCHSKLRMQNKYERMARVVAKCDRYVLAVVAAQPRHSGLDICHMVTEISFETSSSVLFNFLALQRLPSIHSVQLRPKRRHREVGQTSHSQLWGSGYV